MDPTKLIALAVDVAIGLALLTVAYFAIGFLQAPAKLEAAQANNAALKAGSDKQNAAIDGLVVEGKKRKAVSQEAVKNAGKAELAAAERIAGTTPAGDTPLARAANLINDEFAK